MITEAVDIEKACLLMQKNDQQTFTISDVTDVCALLATVANLAEAGIIVRMVRKGRVVNFKCVSNRQM